MSTPSFEGFTRPQANFYRLPLTWFDTLRALREQHERRRIVALVRPDMQRPAERAFIMPILVARRSAQPQKRAA